MRQKHVVAIRIAVGLTAALVAGFLFGSAAHAQESGAICTDRKGAGEKLGETYKEARVNMGLASNGSVIEVFSTEDGGTFTLMITNPNGITCMMAAGKNWESFPFELTKEIRYGNPL